MATSEKDAAAFFAEGFNCAQSVLAPHARRLGLETEAALKLSAAFGGGMGRKGEVCGAATGALMVLGLTCGSTLATDKEAKERTYRLTHRFLDEFARQNGSILCRELLGCQIDQPEGRQKAQELGVFTTLCPRLVNEAAMLIEKVLADEEL